MPYTDEHDSLAHTSAVAQTHPRSSDNGHNEVVVLGEASRCNFPFGHITVRGKLQLLN